MTKPIARRLTRTALGAALGLALAAPAFAQSSQSQPSQSQPSQGGSAAQSPGGQRSQPQAMSQDKLRQQLTQAGFREVQILDAAYLVRAKTQDGNTVLMMIDPPPGGMQSSGMTGGDRGAGTSGSSGGASPSASGGSSGNQPGGQSR
ncbi:hypothetical protein [Roseicella aerolata]|uniref:PepSY domain-containing protein n=1 Tax=Roseicella aerolata TaxID=2883479 RepID=A0A9X1IFH4_9PROT|nr:hypothetical protein [Roseicella aerolata]MCB4823572.1 hypothetical protein [Roseicella aerolata]